MRKINFNKPINNIRGEQLENEVDDPISPKGEKTKIKKKLTAGDMMLNLLSQNISLKDNREAFWITELGIIIADSKGEIELSEDKFVFLKRIIEANKFKERDPRTGVFTESDYFLPFVLGQMLALFQEEEKSKPKKVK